MKPIGLWAVAVGSALALSGCALSTDHTPGSVYKLQPARGGSDASHFTFPYAYESVEHLMEDATDIVVAKPVAWQEIPGARPALAMTDVTFHVEDVLAGKFTEGQEIVVHYTGGIDTANIPEFPNHPKDGLQYLLVLSTWHVDGKTLYVTGPAQWVREFKDQRFAIDVFEPVQLTEDSTVPLDTTIEEFERELQRLAR